MVLSWAQREVLGELRAGPHFENLRYQKTYRALFKRGLVNFEYYTDSGYRWSLTTAGKRVVLEWGLVAQSQRQAG